MKEIKKFEDLHLLKLPDDLYQKLLSFLTEPFDSDEKIAAEFWVNSQSSLIFAEHLNEVELDPAQSPLLEQMRFISENSEFVERLETTAGSYLLALAIVHDFGTGIYLLIPEVLGTQINPPLIQTS